MLSDGFIEVKNLPMGARMDGREIGSNIVIVVFKFSFAMWENEPRCLEDNSPSNNPISMGFDSFGGFGSTEMQLEVTNVFDCSVIGASRVHG